MFCIGLVSLAALMGSSVERAFAEEPINTGYFGDVAIKGYDPVAYFTDGKAVEGDERYSYRWLGAVWHFSSAAHRDLFLGDPSKYAPQYGGYCADGVSFGTVTTNVDPRAWRIIDDKLYISYDPGAAEGMQKIPTKVGDSQKNWPDVQQTLISDKLHKDWQHPAQQ
jgi:YHS domain-containing protein